MVVKSTLMMLSTYSRRCRDLYVFCPVQERSLHSRLSDGVGNVVGPLARHVVKEEREWEHQFVCVACGYYDVA